MEAMIDALIQKVWSNPALADAVDRLERDWLVQALRLSEIERPSIPRADARRYIEVAGILSCSERADQRLTAYRMATYAYELFRGQLDGLESSVRAVLTRLGNFPSLVTAEGVNTALPNAPWVIAQEELARRLYNEVSIDGKPLVLTDFQKLLWTDLRAGGSLAISAPTSTGKSFVLQSFISHRLTLDPGFAACYIVPTRALISQVQMDMSAAIAAAGIADVEVVTVPVEEGDQLPGKAVYVLTQERLQLLLKNHPDKIMDFIVVDEAHSVQDGDRGIILQSTIDELLFRKPTAQLLFASPSVENLEVFGEMTGRGDVIGKATEQVAVSQNFIEMEVTSAARGHLKIYARSAVDRRFVGDAELGQHLASRVECLVHVAHKFGADKQSIVFADGQADAEKLAFQISDMRVAEGGSSESDALNELAELAKEAVHPKYIMALTVRNGVAFHYGNIPTILRTAVEQAFISGDLQYLVCTSTLLAGVNLPARNLFLCQPLRKKGTPLQSVDFWNLAGRAGRLRREFQGNIFLINYEAWKVQPLSGPRLTRIKPSIQNTIETRGDDLQSVILDDSLSAAAGSDAGLETIFVRLLTDFKLGRVRQTLDQADVSLEGPLRSKLEDALAVADKAISLPADVLNASPTISGYRQQRLFDIFIERIEGGGEVAAKRLLLAHPREGGAFESYVDALSICHGTIIARPGSLKQNRFFALMLLKWMQGVSISELVDGRAAYYKDENINVTIRQTLDLVEKELRFNYVRVFGCYASLLSLALKNKGLEDMRKSLPSIALYLEVGASDKTMISFIALGLSRLAAKRLTNICPIKTFNVEEARVWLLRQDLEVLGFSKYIRREVDLALKTANA
jgi:superfamily II DNA/RNA helicase